MKDARINACQNGNKWGKMKQYLSLAMKGGIRMAELVCRSMKQLLHLGSSMPDLWPNTDYQKHVPKNAEELMRTNWETTGKSLRKAMDKVEKEYGEE